MCRFAILWPIFAYIAQRQYAHLLYLTDPGIKLTGSLSQQLYAKCCVSTGPSSSILDHSFGHVHRSVEGSSCLTSGLGLHSPRGSLSQTLRVFKRSSGLCQTDTLFFLPLNISHHTEKISSTSDQHRKITHLSLAKTHKSLHSPFRTLPTTSHHQSQSNDDDN